MFHFSDIFIFSLLVTLMELIAFNDVRRIN